MKKIFAFLLASLFFLFVTLTITPSAMAWTDYTFTASNISWNATTHELKFDISNLSTPLTTPVYQLILRDPNTGVIPYEYDFSDANATECNNWTFCDLILSGPGGDMSNLQIFFIQLPQSGPNWRSQSLNLNPGVLFYDSFDGSSELHAYNNAWQCAAVFSNPSNPKCYGSDGFSGGFNVVTDHLEPIGFDPGYIYTGVNVPDNACASLDFDWSQGGDWTAVLFHSQQSYYEGLYIERPGREANYDISYISSDGSNPTAQINFDPNVPHNLKVCFSGTTVQGYLDNNLEISGQDPHSPNQGNYVGMAAQQVTWAGNPRLDNFTIQSFNHPTPQLTALSSAKVYVGLKNSDDVGVKFDLKAEVYKDNTLVTSGEIDNVAAGSSGFNNAKLDTIPFNSFSSIDFPSGSQLKLIVYVRNACTGSGHNSGTARLWYNDSQTNSQFGATIGSNNSTYYLLNNFLLGTSVGSGPKQTIDVQSGAKCSAFKSFGTWTITP